MMLLLELLMMFIGRVAARNYFLIGSLGLVGAWCRIFVGHPAIRIFFLHRFDTWKSRITNFTEKEEVPAAKFDIDKAFTDSACLYCYCNK